MKEKIVTAGTILELLAAKHLGDVFVPECKDGPTWGGTHFRLDGWAMKRSWTQPMVSGYEIKVSRSDFIQDDKWRPYLALCNCFYFVCPFQMIDPSELPADVGLMWVAKTGTRLWTKRKAPYRDVVIPEELYRYILYSRAKILAVGAERYGPEETGREFWEQWMQGKKHNYEFSSELRGKLKAKYEKDVTEVREKNKKLKRENDELSEIKKVIKDLGLSPHVSSWIVGKKVEEFINGYDRDCKRRIEDAIEALNDVKDAMKK